MEVREMIEAMMAGKRLIFGGTEAYYREDGYTPFWFVGPDGKEEPLMGWQAPWKIKEEPKKRFMTRNEILAFIAYNPHIVVKWKDELEWHSSRSFSVRYDNPMNFEWATITEDGCIGKAQEFEVEA